MATINELTTLNTLIPSDLFPVYSSNNGDARKVPASVLTSYILSQNTVTTPPQYAWVNQTFAPAVTGWVINLTYTNNNVFLVIEPIPTTSAGTINMPSVFSMSEGVELVCTCLQSIKWLTINGGGAFLVNAPTAVAANGSFHLRFSDDTWYRIG